MSATPVEEPPAQEPFSQETSAQEGSSGSGQTLPFRPLQPISDPSASKRVCFYKSGDYKFSGHRMVINARTFKSFDALLDTLSKKVPLPFGRRVKPINLEEVNRRQVPWNTTRPPSVGRKRRQGSRLGPLRRTNYVVTNIVPKRVTVRTPKRLVVIKNKDPNVKRTIVLQRKTAPTFDALLDYLSQSLLFPVLKLFSTDGRRIDGLAGLILCSGVVVAAGSEPFRLGNYSSQGAGQMAQIMYMDPVEPSVLQPGTDNNKSFSSGRGSRNFSLSSERCIVNQINKSINGSTNGPLNQHNRSFETEVEPHPTSKDKCGVGMADNDSHTRIVPHDDDIEKSFRVNQDGSMTVEMKVRLTIKEEEMLHWTTTLSRSSLRNGTVSASVSEPGNSSPDSNNTVAKESSSVSEDESKEKNHTSKIGKGVGFNDEQACEGYNSTAFRKTGFKRTLTPGPLHVTKRASLESVKTVTESGVQENTMGHYSYIERTADGETTEEYCVLKHSSSSSNNRLIPRPRQTKSSEASSKGSPSSISSSGVAEVLQIQSNGMEVTETVMHIYESQPCYDNYFANDEYSTDVPTVSPSPTEIHQYVENWLEKVSPDPVPYTEEELTEPRTKVVFQIGDDSDSDEKNECQANPDGYNTSPSDDIEKSVSCLSVPYLNEATAQRRNEKPLRGLCASMPSVRVDLVSNENRLRPNKSAAILGTVDNESPSSTPKGLDTKANIVPLLRELYSSIHCLKSASETNVTSNLERSSSLPDFSKQVAGVFGSSCKAFVSFLSVMTLRDNQITSAPRDGNQSSTSEALLMLESLQRISATEDEGGLSASLTDLHSRTSSTFRERWKDFQIMRERLE
ncbi:Oxygen-regulated protein 1 [Dissostichus eleginoides]|uniref:Oxygen-regulated protein 1 n=1 Tax=Dissostichus eleginoides TaxID=100907 RepID=A0AAD9B9J4_DISEL|nr:Oxygen-regulated protein 1 [Dissostichus eleginoides]